MGSFFFLKNVVALASFQSSGEEPDFNDVAYFCQKISNFTFEFFSEFSVDCQQASVTC